MGVSKHLAEMVCQVLQNSVSVVAIHFIIVRLGLEVKQDMRRRMLEYRLAANGD